MKIPIEKDPEKAKALLKMAEVTIERLNELGIKKYSSNSLVDYYDSIHKLCESLSLLEGVKFKGEGAHFELINHICERYGVSSSNRQFLQDLRDYRNRISYEGFSISQKFIENSLQRIVLIIKKLTKLILEEIEE